MPKWDDKTVVLTGGFMGRHKEELNRSTLEQQFDSLGQQGFELAWILMNQALQGEKDGHVVIFKRRVDPAVEEGQAEPESVGVSLGSFLSEPGQARSGQ